MMSTARELARGGRLRLVVAGAVVLTALATATASASPPPAETPARRTTQLPVFVLDKGRFTTFDAPAGPRMAAGSPSRSPPNYRTVGSWPSAQTAAACM